MGDNLLLLPLQIDVQQSIDFLIWSRIVQNSIADEYDANHLIKLSTQLARY